MAELVSPAARVQRLVEAGDLAAARQEVEAVADAASRRRLKKRLGPDPLALGVFLACLAGLAVLAVVTLVH